MFGNGETTYHVIVELYSGGNIILTNYEFEVMFLLRSYTLNDGTQVDVKHQYNFHPSIRFPLPRFFSRAAQSLRCHPIPHRLLSQGLVLRASLALERVKIEGKTGKVRSLRQLSHRSPRTAFCRQMSSPGRRGSCLHHPKRGFFRQRNGPRAITRGYPIRGAVPRAIHRIPAGLHSLRGRSGAGDGNDSRVRAVRGIRSV